MDYNINIYRRINFKNERPRKVNKSTSCDTNITNYKILNKIYILGKYTNENKNNKKMTKTVSVNISNLSNSYSLDSTRKIKINSKPINSSKTLINNHKINKAKFSYYKKNNKDYIISKHVSKFISRNINLRKNVNFKISEISKDSKIDLYKSTNTKIKNKYEISAPKCYIPNKILRKEIKLNKIFFDKCSQRINNNKKKQINIYIKKKYNENDSSNSLFTKIFKSKETKIKKDNIIKLSRSIQKENETDKKNKNNLNKKRIIKVMNGLKGKNNTFIKNPIFNVTNIKFENIYLDRKVNIKNLIIRPK